MLRNCSDQMDISASLQLVEQLLISGKKVADWAHEYELPAALTSREAEN